MYGIYLYTVDDINIDVFPNFLKITMFYMNWSYYIIIATVNISYVYENNY